MKNKMLYIIMHPSIIKVYLSKKLQLDTDDEKYLKSLYEYRINKKLNLDNPQTFNEKLQWLKLHDRKDIYTTMVDKYEAKKYVANIIGDEYIIPTLSVYDKFDDIDFDKLPNQFVIKCTHDSGGLVICKDKSKFNKNEAKKKINKCLKKNFYYNGREWPYKNVRPRIIIETYMNDANTDGLIDYKIMCFNGEPKISFTCTDRQKGDLKVTWFDLDWNKLPFERHYRSSSEDIKRPVNYNKMIEFSMILAQNIPFVRVDWYEIGEKLYFGELTLYPGCGFEEFNPEEWDYKLGSWIDLSNIKNEGVVNE